MYVSPLPCTKKIIVLISLLHSLRRTKNTIEQSLDEVEHDIMNYQYRGLSYLPKPKPKAEADNTDMRFNNSWYYAKTEFNNCFIIHFSTIWKKKRYLETRQTLSSKWQPNICSLSVNFTRFCTVFSRPISVFAVSIIFINFDYS